MTSLQPPMTSRPNNTQLDLESLQKQIDMLQVQLMNAQRAMKTATTNNATISGNMAPSISSAAGVSNGNGANEIVEHRDPSPLSYVSNDAIVAPCWSNQQQMMAAQPQSTQPTAATYPMQPHRKIYDLPEFSGAAEDWPMFLSAFDHTTAAYGYNNFENCLRLQKALKGQALECVKSLLIHPNNTPTAIEQLKFQYGRPELLIRCQLQQVREILPIAENAIEMLVPFAIKVRNLAAFLETANGQQHLSNPTLMDELVQKLPMNRRLDWAQYASSLRSWPTVLDFSNWLQGVANLIRSVQSTG